MIHDAASPDCPICTPEPSHMCARCRPEEFEEAVYLHKLRMRCMSHAEFLAEVSRMQPDPTKQHITAANLRYTVHVLAEPLAYAACRECANCGASKARFDGFCCGCGYGGTGSGYVSYQLTYHVGTSKPRTQALAPAKMPKKWQQMEIL